MSPALPEDAAFTAPGRFWKGDIHPLSMASDGISTPTAVGATDRAATCDFPALTGPCMAKDGGPVVATQPFRVGGFTPVYVENGTP